MSQKAVSLTPTLKATGLILAGFLALPGCFSNNKVIGNGDSAGNGAEQGAMFLTKVEWGRLVDVVDQDGTLVDTDVVIRPDLQLGADYSLTVNPVTEAETLTILQYSEGSAGFDSLLEAAQSNLVTVTQKGPASPQPYTLVARNAAVRLSFSRPLKASTVNADTIQFWVGDLNASPADGRYIVQNDDENGTGAVIFDPTISGRQSAELSLPQNASGFAASLDSVNDNLILRIPTEVNVFDGRPQVLESAGGRTVRIATGEPVTSNSDGSLNIARSMRSGNGTDIYRGFLRDNSPPSVVGVFDVTLSAVVDLGGDLRRITYSLSEAVCDGIRAKVGDVLEVDGAIVLINTVNTGAGAPYEVEGTVLEGTLASLPSDPSGQLTTRYSKNDEAFQSCFIRVSPTPGTFPLQDLEQDASLIVRFSEAIDATTVLSMHSLVLTAFETGATAPDVTAPFRSGGEFANESVGEYIDRQRGFHLPLSATGTAGNAEFGGRVLFGSIEVADGNRQFTLTPTAGFVDPDDGGSPTYSLAVRDGVGGITDLAGNTLQFEGFVAGSTGAGAMALTCAAPSSGAVKYLALRANATDEDNDGLPEYAGQHTPGDGVLTGRPVVHFSRTADTANDYVSTGTPPADPATGLAAYPFEPLTPRGAVVMGMWRPEDFGFGAPSTETAFFDPQEFNIDIEGFNWSPFGGVNDDFFPRVSLSFSHARWIPDESVDLTGRAIFPASGLQVSLPFVQNVLGWDAGITETTVFDSSYAVRSIDVFSADSGQPYLPWPDFTDYFTFRDTTIPQLIADGAGGSGSPPAVHGLGASAGGFYAAGDVPSVGLSLLGRFRCYNVGNIEPINQFNAYQFIVNSPLPAWRVFSAGGVSSNGDVITVVPDNGDQGGLQPTGGWRNGVATRPDDDTIYWAQADFVVRVSRAYTHWFDMGGVLPDAGVQGIVLEPVEAFQAPGTEVIVEYRGSFSVAHPANPQTRPSPLTDAEKTLDYYGDFNGSSGSVSLPSAWTRDLTDLEASATEQYRYLQLRISFVADAERNLPATLDGLGIAFDITP